MFNYKNCNRYEAIEQLVFRRVIKHSIGVVMIISSIFPGTKSINNEKNLFIYDSAYTTFFNRG
jgi:hypothetical protein